jgi:hypothetical protein
MDWLGPESKERSASSVVAEGIVSSTPIATPLGWRMAASLIVGQDVLTFDNGPQPVTSARIVALGSGSMAHWPLLVPPWALDNRDELILLPEQKVLIEADLAETLYGDPFAMIPSQAMEGWRGITRWRPPQGAAAVLLEFEQPQVIYASRGILLSCPGDPYTEADWFDATHVHYTLAQARHLITCLMAEETGAALRGLGQHRPSGLMDD